jgi:hypothetical protein
MVLILCSDRHSAVRMLATVDRTLLAFEALLVENAKQLLCKAQRYMLLHHVFPP